MSRTVLFVQSNAERYGSDRSLAMLVRELVSRGWRVEVALPAEGPTVEELRSCGAVLHVLDPAPLRRTRRSGWARYVLIELPTAVWRIRRLARRADLVHVNTSITLGGVLGGWVARRPVVLHLRESYTGRERLFRAYGRLLRLTARAVVAISEGIRDEAAAAGLADRTIVIHNGLALDAQPVPVSLDRTGPLVMVGRINDWKGHVELVEALALLRDRGLVVPAAIAGSVFPGGEAHETALRAAMARLGLDDQVELLGFVDDVPTLLATASIFVMPSVRPEPFGLALVEAMASGVPCIATDAGGPRDIVRDGETGLLVPCGDVPALAAAIEQLWCSPSMRKRLAAEAWVDVRERFAIGTTAARVDSLYRELLAS